MTYRAPNGTTGSVKGSEFTPYKSQAEADASVKPDLSEMTAPEVLEAVEEGEVTKAEALKAEKKRSTPRKTILNEVKG